MNPFKQKSSHPQKGFTIVELIIVIAVIAVLALIIILAYNGVQQRARDSQRLSALTELKTEIESYYVDNGNYPTCGGNISCTSTGYQGDIGTLVSPSIAPDPMNSNGTWGYYYARGYKKTSANTFSYTNSDQDYVIATRLESSSVAGFHGWNNNNINFLDGK